MTHEEITERMFRDSPPTPRSPVMTIPLCPDERVEGPLYIKREPHEEQSATGVTVQPFPSLALNQGSVAGPSQEPNAGPSEAEGEEDIGEDIGETFQGPASFQGLGILL